MEQEGGPPADTPQPPPDPNPEPAEQPGQVGNRFPNDA
jgi:hypothetical protein